MPAPPSIGKQQLETLTNVILAFRHAPFPAPATAVPLDERKQIAGHLLSLADLTSPAFAIHSAPWIVARYATLRFAQSAKNGAFRITTEQLRRDLAKLRNADTRDACTIEEILAAISPQARDRLTQSLLKASVAIPGSSAQDLAGVDPRLLAQAAADALEHPHLQKHARGRKPDRAGDALIDSVRSAFKTVFDEPITIWADGVSVSRFVSIVQLLFALAGDPRSEATLRDRCRTALKRPPPRPPWEGVIFGRN
ncbi:MAG: hypothetical protein JF591_15275 [Lysobacter sp.]|nr:hypothetical protein [Lysobacter sp.]